jgi:uncharacterized membrane protein YbhN (UPF0104 family)
MPSLALIVSVLGVAVGGLFLVAASTVRTFAGFHVPWFLWAAGSIMCLQAFVLGTPIPQRLTRLPGRAGRWLHLACQGWQHLRGDRPALLGACLSHLGLLCLSTVSMVLSFNAVNVPISLPSAAMVVALCTLTMVATITPGNLGIREFLVASTAECAGVGFHEGVAAALILRAAALIVNLVGGAIGYWWLFMGPRSREG